MRSRRPSSAMVVALLALFVALGGTAVAAGVVPLAKRALYANNAGKLQGKTAAQVAALPSPAIALDGKSAAEIAAMPSPAVSAAGLVTVASRPFTIGKDAEGDYPVSCPAGTSVLSAGQTWVSADAAVIVTDSRPTSATTWALYMINLSETSPAAGMLYAVCLE